ncbi:MAG: hypothetical protein WBG80_01630, partial [Bacteroidota bacterium]
MSHTSSFARQSLLALTILLCTSGAIAQESRHPTARFHHEPTYKPPEHPVDMEHMRLEVSFLPRQGIVRGRV